MIEKVQALIQRVASGNIAEASRKAAIDVVRLEEAQSGSVDRWTTAMVERLARAAGIDPAAVWSVGPLPAAPTVLFLRGAWPDFNEVDVPILMDALEDASALRTLALDVLKLKRLFKDSDRVQVSEPAFEHGYRLAILLRNRAGMPTQPIRDIHELASGLLHVHVVYRKLKTVRLHAVTLMSQEGAAIVVNKALESRDVMHRRTIAHELAHAIFDPFQGNLHTVVEDELDGDIDDSPHERRARAFAAELLVPSAGLEQLLKKPGKVRSVDDAVKMVQTVGDTYLAPPEMVANHLANRNYVDKSIRERLIAAVRDHDPIVQDPYSDWLRVRAREALDAELISMNRAKAILKLSVYDRDLVA